MKHKFIMKWIKFLIIVYLFVAAAEGIRIMSLDVPEKALVGDEVRLRCDYKMDGGSSLYSLKWYKDGKEFYRHLPGNGQSDSHRCSAATTNPVLPGVTIDCWGTSEREVVLTDVSRATSGEYRCEVIGDHPAFRREERKGRLTVYSEPLKKPVIQGAASAYAIGNEVSLNCSSRNVEYTPTLSWFINGQPASEHDPYPYTSNHETKVLFFLADKTRFIHGQVEVTCQAKLGSLHGQNTTKTLAIPGLLSPQYYSQGSHPETTFGFPVALFLLISALV